MRNNLQPTKKYISKEMAMEKLKVTPRMFEKLIVLCKVFPVFAEKKKCLDQTDGIYYMINDIRKIGYSDAYSRFIKNKSYMWKKDKYMSSGRIEKANRFYECDYNYVELIKDHYESFGDCLNAVGETVTNLYLINMLGLEDVLKTIEKWELFCTEYGTLEKGFLGRKGVYCFFNVKKIRVLWCIPYIVDNLDGSYEIKKDLMKKIKMEPMKIGEYEDEEYEDSEETFIDLNSNNKHDVSLLKNGAKLYATHVELVLNKLKIIMEKRKEGLFTNFKICISVNSIKHHLEFILSSMGCKLVCEEEADIIVTESVDVIKKGVIYVQPQYIIDSLNKGEILDCKDYMIGKKLLPHLSPFSNIGDFIEERVLQRLSNNRKQKILSKIEDLDQNLNLY